MTTPSRKLQLPSDFLPPMYCMRCPFYVHRVCGCYHSTVEVTRASYVATSFCPSTCGSIHFNAQWLQHGPNKYNRELDPKHAERERPAKEGNIRISNIKVFRFFNNRQSRKQCTKLSFTTASGTRGIWQAGYQCRRGHHDSATICWRNSCEKA